MNLAGHTVLITGGGTGIGAGLAAAFHEAGSKVIIGGRREKELTAMTARYPGMERVSLDVCDEDSIRAAVIRLEPRHPRLDILVNNAGIQSVADFAFRAPATAQLDAEIDTNFRGLVHMTAAVLPILKRQFMGAWIVNVSSGLHFIPMASMPVYCATKAAVHSFTVSLRHQLRTSPIRVVELVPPAVRTALDASGKPSEHHEMPVEDFVPLAMVGLKADRAEILVGGARRLKWGSRIAPGLFFRFLNG